MLLTSLGQGPLGRGGSEGTHLILMLYQAVVGGRSCYHAIANPFATTDCSAEAKPTAGIAWKPNTYFLGAVVMQVVVVLWCFSWCPFLLRPCCMLLVRCDGICERAAVSLDLA